MFGPSFTRVALFLSVFFLTACQAPGDTLHIGNVQVALPLVEKHWRIETPAKEDKAVWCVVTAGPNSLALTLGRTDKNGAAPVELRSTRELTPGSNLTVQADSHYYSTPQTVFSPADMRHLVADMRQGGELYLDWREEGRGSGTGHNRLQSRISLAEFNDAYAECENYLAPLGSKSRKHLGKKIIR